ncbi:glycoside hydrolase 43 family protein [Asticcacaulis sp. 201]|uniref:glycoside hydrolase family 43 protein n=1 Tax=Asticcacaulis sp. 201 TaxID=3028787 RepID=UPI002916C05F|nr:family 43 glycosylhydrolase [Asticcacaulis sp. 201]MDV6330122.1 family 43 glycosylhydrolase [Asticcacaulis sp. 201]
MNPIMPADYSDIDVIRVGARYYAISSTLHMSPGMVVMQSDDLVNWQTLGHAVPDITPLGANLTWREMDGYGRGVWAGALRYHNHRFYLYFACPDSGVFVTTARDPKGPWATPICLWHVAGYDDPCPFWDDDGRAYLIMTRFAKDPDTQVDYNIHLFEMSADGLSLNTSKSRIVHRSEGSEANKLDKRDGVYYHYFSEVKPEGRVPMMRRARSLAGPWEERQLGHVDKNIDREPNQGGFIQSPDGNWWFLTHQGRGDWEGRALCLLPVTWTDGWPIVGTPGDDGIGNMVWQHRLPISGTRPKTVKLSADFSKPLLGTQWEWNHEPNPAAWRLQPNLGRLRLKAFRPLGPDFKMVANVVSQRAWRTNRNQVTTQMHLSEMTDGQIAGLCHASASSAFIGIRQAGNVRRVLFQAGTLEVFGPPVRQTTIWLRTEWDFGGNAQFSYSLNGRTFRALGPGYSLGWGNYRGDRVGLFTFNPKRDSGAASFSTFTYQIAAQNGAADAGFG